MSFRTRQDRTTSGAGNARSRAGHRLRVLLPWILLVTGSVVAACSPSGGIDASPTVPLITAKPFVEPEPTDTPEPTRKPLSVAEVTLTESVQAGDKAKVVIKTATAADCVIEVTYDTGPSEAAGLEGKTADGAGKVTWSWTVGLNTATGRYPIDVSCFKGERQGSLSLSFKVR